MCQSAKQIVMYREPPGGTVRRAVC
jgi:hypothetical protein